MPELPEVETIIQQLRKRIVGKEISAVEITDHKVAHHSIRKNLPYTIIAVQRRGKTIIAQLDNGGYLLMHLRMTGHFWYVGEDTKDVPYSKYRAATFRFTDGSFLTHNSIRRFGKIRMVTEKRLQKSLAALGPEPLELSKDRFVERLLAYPQSAVKAMLMDQRCLAGIGNIYAQEAVYHAGIRPDTKIGKIPTQRIEKLHSELQRVLTLAIKHNGSSVRTYQSIDGKGTFQNLLAVYQQEQCPKKHPLKKMLVGGRGTWYCPTCQK